MDKTRTFLVGFAWKRQRKQKSNLNQNMKFTMERDIAYILQIETLNQTWPTRHLS